MCARNKTDKPNQPSAGGVARVKKSAAELEEEAALARPTQEFSSGHELMAAIAQQCDLVAVGSKLLRDGEAKGASVRARMFETTVEYLYGKPAAAQTAEAPAVQIIWDMPGPDRERITE